MSLVCRKEGSCLQAIQLVPHRLQASYESRSYHLDRELELERIPEGEPVIAGQGAINLLVVHGGKSGVGIGQVINIQLHTPLLSVEADETIEHIVRIDVKCVGRITGGDAIMLPA